MSETDTVQRRLFGEFMFGGLCTDFEWVGVWELGNNSGEEREGIVREEEAHAWCEGMWIVGADGIVGIGEIVVGFLVGGILCNLVRKTDDNSIEV